MPDTLNAAELRRHAMQCAARADDPSCPPAERERIMRIRESLLALARSADWLAGKAAD
jgi:hypothetical protein